MSFTFQPCRIANLLNNCITGRSYLEGKLWRAGQSACCLSSDRLESVAQSSLKQKNMWEQLKSGKLHTNLCTLNNCVADFVFHHRLVGIYIEAFGAGKGEEDCTYNGFGDLDDEESEDVEDDHAE